MIRAALLCPVLLMLGGCAPAPSWYGVPAQHKPVGDGTAPAAAAAPQIGESMCAVDENADAYIVKDVKGLEAVWRWTNAEPEFRFLLKPGTAGRTFFVEFGINDRTFQETGPLKLVFEVNGREFARQRFDTYGDQTWERRVSAELLAPGAENRVKIRVLNPWQAPDPGVKLGFVLKCVGFRPR